MEEALIILAKFCKAKGILITRERKLLNGIQVSVLKDESEVHLTFFRTGNILVQGKDSLLKEVFLNWADNKTIVDGMLRLELPSGWREWNTEADWLKQYIEKNGYPTEEKIGHDYRLTRETLFHDYMFRQKQFNPIELDRFLQIVRNWLNRYCYMNLNYEGLINDIRQTCINKEYIDTDDKQITFGAATEIISYHFAAHCTAKHIYHKKAFRCPQTDDEHYTCVIDLVDAVFPYFSDSVIAYTKGNMEKLIKRNYGVNWYSLKASTPIEEAMQKGLSDAGILNIPQFQAFDENHRYKIDFVIKTSEGPHLAIECDGLEFHGRKETYIRDRVRDRYLQKNGFYMMRFSSVEIFNKLENCVKEIDEVFWKIQNKKINTNMPYRLSYFGYSEE